MTRYELHRILERHRERIESEDGPRRYDCHVALGVTAEALDLERRGREVLVEWAIRRKRREASCLRLLRPDARISK